MHMPTAVVVFFLLPAAVILALRGQFGVDVPAILDAGAAALRNWILAR
jgi:hypothetical protein